MFTFDGATTAALIGALVGGLVGILGTVVAEHARRRDRNRTELRAAIGDFLTVLTEHAATRILENDNPNEIGRLELRATTAANVVAMHLNQSQNAVAKIALGAVINVAPPEKQFDRAEAVGATLRAWYRGDVSTRKVERFFAGEIAKSPTAQM